MIRKILNFKIGQGTYNHRTRVLIYNNSQIKLFRIILMK